jgi:Kdo2-lipid IVA lauroyltransferase/acyltransferase
MIKILKYLLQSIIVYFSFILARILGLNISQQFFSKLFQFIGPKFKSKKIIDENLNKYNSKMTAESKKKIILEMWSNYGKTFIEYIFLDKFRKNSKHINIINKNILEEIIKTNKPVVFISGHFANFELMSMEITKQKIKLATIYRPLNNYFLNPFMEFLRRRYICKNQIKKGRAGVRDVIKFVENGFSIALMIDQRVTEGKSVNFFNSPCLTTTLPAQLALKYNLNIVPVSIKRDIHNNFELIFHTAIDINQYNDKFNLTKHLNNHLESMLNKNPGQWIWTHNRWKL